MPRRRSSLALVVTVALTMAACGGDDDAGDDTTTSSSGSSTSADAAGSSSSTTTEGATSSSIDVPTYDAPEDAAQCLFDAWLADDESAAQSCADDIAIDELFGHSSDGADETLTYQGCFEEELQFRCSWTYEGGAMGFIVVDSDAYGWRVSDIEYRAD